MKYKNYKYSDIPWVGMIPSTWKLVPNKVLYKKHLTKLGEKSDTCQLLSLTTHGIKQKDPYDVKGKVPTSYEGYQEVHINDMVFCLFDLDVSAVFSGVSEYEGMITSAYDVVECNPALIVSQYADYWFQFAFSNRYYKIYSKNVRYTLSYDAFGAIKSPLPSLQEQKQIVRYLDWQVSKINKLIQGYQKQIELIHEQAEVNICSAVFKGLDSNAELKDSGIQNIGMIPSHWRVLQNKRIFAERSELSTTGQETLLSVSKHYGVKPYNELQEDEQFATIKPAETLVGYKKVYINDLAMNIMRARNGSFGISEYEGIVSAAYAVFKPIIPMNPRYMHHMLKSPHVVGIFESHSYGIAEHRRRLYADYFLRLYLPVPPIEEQDQIAEFVEAEEAKAQRAALAIKQEISLLREYRTRLISDVVTGQIDVRGIEIPEYTPIEDMEIDMNTGSYEEV